MQNIVLGQTRGRSGIDHFRTSIVFAPTVVGPAKEFHVENLQQDSRKVTPVVEMAVSIGMTLCPLPVFLGYPIPD